MSYSIGAVLAIAVGLFGQAVGFDRSRAYYPVLLIVIAAYYVLFAVMGGSISALWQESMVLAAFVAMSVVGFRVSLWIVAAGLLAHGILDAVHPNLIDNPGAPEWWPAFCLAFDVVLAGYLAIRLRALAKRSEPGRNLASQ